MKTTTATKTECPNCGTAGKTVKPVTLRALLKEQYALEVAAEEHDDCEAGCRPSKGNTGWRFCASTGCDVVYFGEQNGITFTKAQLTVEVGVKETTGERPLCYCFGHSVASIKEELQARGSSEALDDIRAKMKNVGCSCEVTNPSGSCCLGAVAKGVETAKSELPATLSNRSSSSKAETVTKVGTVLSAIMASACCWLPLVLLAVGVSGAGIAATLEAYRPILMVVTFGFLGAAFYLTYRPKKSASGQGCCATTEGEDCCATNNAGRFNMMSMNKIMLWGVTVAAIAFLLFPNYVGTLFGTGGQATVTENMHRSVFKIEGMTCDGCATTVSQAISQVSGVLAVDVSYEQKQAVVGTNAPVQSSAIEDALTKAGYKGELVDSETSPDVIPSDTTNGNEPSQQDEVTELRHTALTIEGMTCEHCATALQERLAGLPEVAEVKVDFKSKKAIVSTPSCCAFPTDKILTTIKAAGFSSAVDESD